MKVRVCVCVSDCACPHACLCADVGVRESARERAARAIAVSPCFRPSPAAAAAAAAGGNEWLLCLRICRAKSRPLLFHYALAKCCNTSNRAHAGLA